MRLCVTCGKRVYGGMTMDSGYLYAHEGKCFNKYMNKTYGKHRWMMLGGTKMDAYGGYYICAADNENGFEGTGIYYSEWYGEEEDENEQSSEDINGEG